MIRSHYHYGQLCRVVTCQHPNTVLLCLPCRVDRHELHAATLDGSCSACECLLRVPRRVS